MSYNFTLQSNNADLRAILNSINELPDKIEHHFQEKNITENNIYVPDEGYDAISKAVVNVSSAATSSPLIIVALPYAAPHTSRQALTETPVSLTITEAGTYKFRWVSLGGNDSDRTVVTQLYKTADGDTASAFSDQYSCAGVSTTCEYTGSCVAGDIITLWMQGYSVDVTTEGGCGGLIAIKQ